MKAGLVVFAGAGPGAPDLMTLRCENAIEEADLIIYAGSLVNPELLRGAKKSCEIHDSSKMALEEMVFRMERAAKVGLKVLRLHTGDPAIYGAIGEQMRELDRLGVAYEVIPGVSSVFASAAALKAELTVPGVSQTVILTRMAGRTPVPVGQELRSLAKHKATMAIFLSVSDISAIVKELIGGGYPVSTAAAIVHRASWDDEFVIMGSLADIANKAAEAKLSRQAMIIVGDSLLNNGEYSKLYDASFAHGWRDASRASVQAPSSIADAERVGEIALYAITGNGLKTAFRIAEKLPDAKIFALDKFSQDSCESFPEGGLPSLLSGNWMQFKAHVFIMAVGIAVRKIAPLLKSKLEDPAVIACDDLGHYCISLAGGHIGGANKLVRKIAAAIGAEPVITTATDTQNIKAFDELASEQGWLIANPHMIKRLNAMLLAPAKIATVLPENVYVENYADNPKVVNFQSLQALDSSFDGAVILAESSEAIDLAVPCLQLVKR